MQLQPIARDWVAARLPARSARAHKGTFGRLLVLAGSIDYAGAALLCGLGAAHTGAGLVCIASPESVILRREQSGRPWNQQGQPRPVPKCSQPLRN